MKKTIFALFVFLLLLTLVTAEPDTAESDAAEIDISQVVNEFNSQFQGQELPSFAKTLFGNERINLHITLENGESLIVGAETINGIFYQLSENYLENPSLNVYTSETAIRKIALSEDQMAAFRTALDNDGIIYQAVGLKNKIKYGVVSFFSKFF